MGEKAKPYPVRIHTADPKHFGGALAVEPDPDFERLSIMYVGGTPQAVFSNPVVAEHFALMPALLQAMAKLSDAATALQENITSPEALEAMASANLEVRDLLEQAADSSGQDVEPHRDDGPLPASPTQRDGALH